MKKRKLKKKNLLIAIILFLLIIGILIGSYIVIEKKEYDKKEKELNSSLNKTLKSIEKDNQETQKILDEEKEALNKEIESLANNDEVIKEELRKLYIVGIGDSVFEDALSEIKKLLPGGYYDAKISRPLVTGNEILSELKNQGKLSDIIVLGLANNGYYSDKTCNRLMEIVGDRTVYWLNSVGPDDPSYNGKFKEFAKNHSNIHIIDWEETSKGHSEYFYSDGTHLKPVGLKAYAQMIYDYIYNDYKNIYNKKIEEKKQEKQKQNQEKFVFYGNDLLISSYEKLSEIYKNTFFYAKQNYSFDELYNKLKEKMDNNELEYNIVLMFDKKLNISDKQYQSLIELCKDYKLYILNLNKKELKLDNKNVKIINFYNEIDKNKEYLMFDKIHLTDKGVNALIEELSKNIEK